MSDQTRIPIIKIWHLLLVPLQGQIDDELAEQLREDILNRIQSAEVSGLLLDVTGLWMMDSHFCANLSQIAAAARLMGCETVICGMAPEIALTLQTMGLELPNVGTALSLEQALSQLGIGTLADPEGWEAGTDLEAGANPGDLGYDEARR